MMLPSDIRNRLVDRKSESNLGLEDSNGAGPPVLDKHWPTRADLAVWQGAAEQVFALSARVVELHVQSGSTVRSRCETVWVIRFHGPAGQGRPGEQN